MPKVATQWNSGATRDSNRGRRVLIPSALTTTPQNHTSQDSIGIIGDIWTMSFTVHHHWSSSSSSSSLASLTSHIATVCHIHPHEVTLYDRVVAWPHSVSRSQSTHASCAAETRELTFRRTPSNESRQATRHMADLGVADYSSEI